MILNYLKLLRVSSYVKNIAIFIPVVSTQILDFEIFKEGISIFIIFSFIASSIYIFNDLCDLKSDQEHPLKKERVLASGRISEKEAKKIMLISLIMPFLLLFLFYKSDYIFYCLLYVLLNIGYSLFLKKIFLIDIIFLTTFFVLRAQIGNALISYHASNWLIFFLFFFFFTLAIIKRLAEINYLGQNMIEKNRPYQFIHYNIIKLAGYISLIISIILIFYYLANVINIDVYKKKEFLFFLIPIYILWILYLFKCVKLKKITTDPVAFAFSDIISYFFLIIVLGILFYARGLI